MTNEALVKRIDEAKEAIRQFTELDASYIRDIDGLHNTLTFADELLQQARDAIPVGDVVTMPRSVYRLLTRPQCKKCGHIPLPPADEVSE